MSEPQRRSIMDYAGILGPLPEGADTVRMQREARGWTPDEIAQAEAEEAEEPADFVLWSDDGESIHDLAIQKPTDLRIEHLGDDRYFLAFTDQHGDRHHLFAEQLRLGWTDDKEEQ